MYKFNVKSNLIYSLSLFLILQFGCSATMFAQDTRKEKSSKSDDDVFKYEDIDVKPEIIKKVSPYYPEIARKAGTEGTVIVKVLVGKNGKVEKTKIEKSIPELDEAALEAAKQYFFKPGMQKGEKVKVWMVIPFKFRLK